MGSPEMHVFPREVPMESHARSHGTSHGVSYGSITVFSYANSLLLHMQIERLMGYLMGHPVGISTGFHGTSHTLSHGGTPWDPMGRIMERNDFPSELMLNPTVLPMSFSWEVPGSMGCPMGRTVHPIV